VEHVAGLTLAVFVGQVSSCNAPRLDSRPGPQRFARVRLAEASILAFRFASHQLPRMAALGA